MYDNPVESVLPFISAIVGDSRYTVSEFSIRPNDKRARLKILFSRTGQFDKPDGVTMYTIAKEKYSEEYEESMRMLKS